MKKEDDRNWSAYIDGELSVSEIEEFEAQFSEDELKHLSNERAFDKSISNSLAEAPACPENLLADVLKQVDREEKKTFLRYKVIAVAALAACLALIFLLPKPGTTGDLVPQTIAELEKMSLTGNTLDDINEYLSKKNIDLEVTEFLPEHHVKTIVGAGIETIAGEEVVTLLFTCCGRPAKVYVLQKGSGAEKFIVNDDKDWKNSIQAQAKRGSYRLAVSSPHNAESILKYINHT